MRLINNNFMRVFVTVLILIFSFQSWTKADNISDFQIEGISIGDSLLDHFTKDEILNATDIHKYKDNKYVFYLLYKKKKFENYDGIQATVKGNDPLFIIYGLDGLIDYKNSGGDECIKKQEEIKADIDNSFGITGLKDNGKHPADKTGNSKYVRYTYRLDDKEVAELICYDMSKKLEDKGQWDALYLTLKSKDFNYFITHEQYD